MEKGPVIRVPLRREREWLEADTAGRIGGLDEATGIREAAGSAGSEKDERWSRLTGCNVTLSGLHVRRLCRERWLAQRTCERSSGVFIRGCAPQRLLRFVFLYRWLSFWYSTNDYHFSWFLKIYFNKEK